MKVDVADVLPASESLCEVCNASALPTLEKCERTLAQRVADGARRVLEVEAAIVSDVKSAPRRDAAGA